MLKFRIRIIGLGLWVTCSLSVSFPGASFASLAERACAAIWRGCVGKCNEGSGSQSCYDACDVKQGTCLSKFATSKQQPPPPPCTGVTCSLRNPHPPTTVSVPPTPPRD